MHTDDAAAGKLCYKLDAIVSTSQECMPRRAGAEVDKVCNGHACPAGAHELASFCNLLGCAAIVHCDNEDRMSDWSSGMGEGC